MGDLGNPVRTYYADAIYPMTFIVLLRDMDRQWCCAADIGADSITEDTIARPLLTILGIRKVLSRKMLSIKSCWASAPTRW